jgi:hypothetical protein
MKNETSSSAQAITGIVWTFMNTVIGKSASLATQIALGWFLSEEDFGLYVLVQRKPEFWPAILSWMPGVLATNC